MELNNNVDIDINQNKFINTSLGKTVNAGIDIGLRALLPDFIEDNIIDLKNNLLEYGLKDGISKTISATLQEGKNAIGIINGNFENISQIQSAIKKGGTIDKISYAIDFAINQINKVGLIDKKTTNILLKGKSVILNSIESNIENTFEKQIKSFENLENCIKNWKDFYSNKDFYGMERQYKQMENVLKNIIPFENTINEARIVENIHNLIKNNGQNFELNQETLELAKKLK